MKQKAKLTAGLILGFLAAIGLDQWTKLLVAKKLMNHSPYEILKGVFELFYSENRGAAFGILQGKIWFFLIIAIVVVGAAVYCIFRLPATRKYLPIHLVAMFLCAGAVGNMIDRFLRGYVVDFLYFKLINFPIFNVADCYVTLSMAALIFLFLFVYKEDDLKLLSGKKHGPEEKGGVD